MPINSSLSHAYFYHWSQLRRSMHRVLWDFPPKFLMDPQRSNWLSTDGCFTFKWCNNADVPSLSHAFWAPHGQRRLSVTNRSVGSRKANFRTGHKQTYLAPRISFVVWAWDVTMSTPASVSLQFYCMKIENALINMANPHPCSDPELFVKS